MRWSITSGSATRGCSSRSAETSARCWCSSNAAGLYAVQAEVSACTAQDSVLKPERVKAKPFGRAARGLDPNRHRAPPTKRQRLKKEGQPLPASSRACARAKPLQGVSAITLARMSALTGLRPA